MSEKDSKHQIFPGALSESPIESAARTNGVLTELSHEFDCQSSEWVLAEPSALSFEEECELYDQSVEKASDLDWTHWSTPKGSNDVEGIAFEEAHVEYQRSLTGGNEDFADLDPFRFDENGFDRHGYNAPGFDTFGYDRSGYDHNEFNIEGYNVKGYDRYGYTIDGQDENSDRRDGLDQNDLADEDEYQLNAGLPPVAVILGDKEASDTESDADNSSCGNCAALENCTYGEQEEDETTPAQTRSDDSNEEQTEEHTPTLTTDRSTEVSNTPAMCNKILIHGTYDGIDMVPVNDIIDPARNQVTSSCLLATVLPFIDMSYKEYMVTDKLEVVFTFQDFNGHLTLSSKIKLSRSLDNDSAEWKTFLGYMNGLLVGNNVGKYCVHAGKELDLNEVARIRVDI